MSGLHRGLVHLGVILICSVLLWPPQIARAQEMTAKIQGFLVSAGSGFRDMEKETVELDGGVQLVYRDQSISCQSARISLRSKKLEAHGNVKIVTTSTVIGGDHIVLDYENGTGVIYNGFVQSGNVVFEGQVLQKVSETEYYVLDANYTSCTNCPASLKFSGTSIRAELGGYAYIKNSLIRSGPIPIFWLPYLIIPLKSDRQSGLLTPEFERTGTGGLAIGQSVFWAISRNTDATITLKNYELRGLKGLVEYRYVVDEHSYGQMNYGLINDQVFKDDIRYNTFRSAAGKGSSINRWYLKYDHYLDLPEDWTHRLQLNDASDLQYPKDFYSETLNHGDSAMENRMSVTKNTRDQHYSFDSSYHVNMLHADPLASNDDAVHRLPELRFSQTSKTIGSSEYLYTVDLNYVNFTRSGKAYDDLTYVASDKIRYPTATKKNPKWESPNEKLLEDGYYRPYSDLIRTGQRLDLNPAIYRSFNILGETVEITPRLSYRETHYFFPNLPLEAGYKDFDSNYVRRYMRAELNTKTTLSRTYGESESLRSNIWKHEIQPEIRYSRLPWIEHRSHPFFGFEDQTEAPYFTQNTVSDEDTGTPYGLQFDYNDRISDRNLLTYSVTNRLVQKRWRNNEPEYRQVAFLRLSQSYDAFQDDRNYANEQPWSDITSLLEVYLDNFETYSLTSYFPYQKVYNSSSRVRVIDDIGRFIQMGYIQKFKIVPGQDADSSSRVKDYNLSVGLISRQLDLVGKITWDASKFEKDEFFNSIDNFGKNTKSYSYIAQLKPPGDCIALRFIFEQVTGGEDKYRLDFQFSFDGKGLKPLSIADLNSIGK